MPRRPPSPCNHEGCNTLVAAGSSGLCGRHRLETSATTRLVLVENEEPEDTGGNAA